MKKLALASILVIFAIGGAAHAGTFDINYRPMAGDINAQFGAAFITGETESGNSQSDFMSGETHVLDLNLAYGISDTFAITFDAANSYSVTSPATPEIGINWQILGEHAFSIDIIGKYGIALTEDAATDIRIGNNNFQLAARLYGASGDFQWGAKVTGQYIFIEGGDIWNINLQAQAMYYFDTMWALKAELNYNFVDISEEQTSIFYDRSVSLGAVFNLSQTSAVQPYVAYHFESTDDNDFDFGDDYWQIGAKFSVQF